MYFTFRVAQKREDAVSKEVTRKLSEADNRKMSRKEKDERCIYSMMFITLNRLYFYIFSFICFFLIFLYSFGLFLDFLVLERVSVLVLKVVFFYFCF